MFETNQRRRILLPVKIKLPPENKKGQAFVMINGSPLRFAITIWFLLVSSNLRRVHSHFFFVQATAISVPLSHRRGTAGNVI